MRTVTYRLADLGKKVSIHIGRLGENEVTRVQIDAGSLFAEYPDAVASMSVENPEGVKYPATVTRDGDLVIWDVRDSDLAKVGHGEIQWTFTENGAILKSAIARTSIGRSIVGDGTPPDPLEDWIEHAEDVLEQVEHAFPTGGTKGQVLAKASNADFDTEWADQTGGGGTGDYEDLENLPKIAGVELKGDKSLHDLGAAAETDIPDVSGFYTKPGSGIPASDLADGVIPDVSGFYTKPSGGIPASDIADGVIPDPEDLIDDTAGAGDTEKVWSADKSAALLSAIQQLPPVRDSIKTGVDLDITDENGNVLIRSKDGDILTKWFDSSNVGGAVDYQADFAYDNTSGSKNISAKFREGDEIVLHLANASDRIKDSIASKEVVYKYTDTSNTEHTITEQYAFCYVHFTFPEDAVSVSVTYGTGLLWGESGTIRFSVYKKGITERKPHIIRVASDGSGDYTSLRSAVDSIEDNNAYNKYRIEIYPGTYEILSYYTAEEISETGFEGLFIGDGISIVGVGQRDEIVLHGTLDTGTYNQTKRNDVSVVNLAGNSGIENITINAEYIRYCVHDDTGPLTAQYAEKEIVNCVFNAENMTTGAIAYGCGISNRRKLHIRNCVFNQEIHIHTHNTGTYSPEVVLENCEGYALSFADYNSTVDIEYNLMNCNFDMILAEYSYGPHNQFLFVNQIGGKNPIIDCESGMMYNLANCFKAKGQISAGQLVNIGRSSRSIVATAVTSADIAAGVSLGYKDGESIIASNGYINSNQVGLSNLSAGDYITIDTDGVLTGGGTQSNAVGVVTGISDRAGGGAYIKLYV